MQPYEILNHFASSHNQDPELVESLLPDDINSVLECGIEEACRIGKSHCNCLATYGANLAMGFLSITYAEFFNHLVSHKLANKWGYTEAEKKDIYKSLKMNVTEVKYDGMIPHTNDFIGYMLIENEHGTHFIGCYQINKVLYIADTKKRGVGVVASKHLFKGDKVVWVKELRRSE